MSFCLDRRGFLRRSAIFGGSLLSCSIPLDRATNAAPLRIDAPVIDQLTVREITDGSHDIFLKGTKLPGLAVSRTGFPEAAQGKTLESEWGLALHKGTEARRYLLDFGFTPDVYANNLELMKIDLGAVDALIISHGHSTIIFLMENRMRYLLLFGPLAIGRMCVGDDSGGHDSIAGPYFGSDHCGTCY